MAQGANGCTPDFPETAHLVPVYNPNLPLFGGGVGKELIT